MIVSTSSAALAAAIDAERWADVGRHLDGSNEPGDVWLRMFARNADALREHRPDVYDRLSAALASDDVVLGDATVRAAKADDVNLIVFNAIALLRKNARSFAIGGLRDGALLAAMAKFPPDLILNRRQNVLLLEPDLGRLIAGLGCCDLTGPRGPIEQKHFDWYVGDGWDERLFDDLAADATKIPPLRTIAASEPRPEIDAAMAEIERKWEALNDERKAEVERYYGELSDSELMSVLGPNPPRRPRVLMITSLYTTVLQYSTYDSADAMRQLGWDVKVLTETSMWNLVAKPAVTAAIAEFKPDLIFQIDHLRYELGEIVPANLPFVCWIQDHFANLTSEGAGATVGPRDFVLTGATYRYVERYGYPRGQCIDMPKVSRKPTDAYSLDLTGSKHGGEDLLYVSHWSLSADSIVLEICQRVRDIADANSEQLMRDCGAEMTKVYAAGGCIRLHADMRDLVRRVAARRGITELNQETEHFFVETLFVRLNNAFYRQQGLLWASEIADELGLSLGIYGNGWDTHPQLARHARGPVKYGPDLENLTRRSTMLLQLEPYACYSHQRMLDALLAGGFALVRTHEYNTVPLKVRDFLTAHVPEDVYKTDDAFACLRTDRERAEFQSLLAEAAPLRAMGDIVDVVRGWQRAGTIGDEPEALPGISQIEFDSKDQMLARVRRFANAPRARREIADAQRQRVESRLTYVAGLRMAMRQIRERLADHLTATTEIESPRMKEAA